MAKWSVLPLRIISCKCLCFRITARKINHRDSRFIQCLSCDAARGLCKFYQNWVILLFNFHVLRLAKFIFLEYFQISGLLACFVNLMIDLWQKYHCPGNVVLKQENIWKCQHQLAEENSPFTKYLLLAAFWFIPLSEYIPIKQKISQALNYFIHPATWKIWLSVCGSIENMIHICSNFKLSFISTWSSF